MIAAAAPAPAPAKALPAAPPAETRNDNMNHPPAMTETVTVEADTSVIEAVQTPERKAKDEAAQNEARKESQAERTGAAGAVARSKHGLAFNRRRTVRSWQLCQAVKGGQGATRWTFLRTAFCSALSTPAKPGRRFRLRRSRVPRARSKRFGYLGGRRGRRTLPFVRCRTTLGSRVSRPRSVPDSDIATVEFATPNTAN